jgi:hypothetical protein
MKMSAFSDVASCSLVEVYRRFAGACCLHDQGDYLMTLCALQRSLDIHCDENVIVNCGVKLI